MNPVDFIPHDLSTPYSQELRVASQAAREAGAYLQEEYRRRHPVEHKGSIDLVTEVDRRSEALLAGLLCTPFPGYGFLGEEQVHSASGDERRWIVDPLDGTTNYVRGYPLFALSIALQAGDQTVLGVVYNPLLEELFAAVQGQGAWMNGVPIRVSHTADLGQALIGSGFPYDAWTNPVDNTRAWARFVKTALSVRCDGSASLDLCSVACGRLDGFWELDLGQWDMAAGALIVQEAGGHVTAASGAPFDLGQNSVLASNGRLHALMLALLANGG